MRLFLLVLCFPAALHMAGCGAPPRDDARLERRPLGSAIDAFKPPSADNVASPTQDAEPEGELTLERTLSFALMHNPGMASAAWSVQIGEAQALQAGLRPNPELELEIEDEDEQFFTIKID